MKYMRLVRITSSYGAMVSVLLVFFTAHALAKDSRSPEQIVEENASKLFSVLNNERERLRANPDLLNELIQETVLPVLDMVSMGKLILGKYWKQASEEQRSSFIQEFKDMLIRIYAKSMLEFGHAQVKVLHNQEQQGKYHTVKTELDIGTGKAPLQIAYVFRNTKLDEWKIFDLSVDGLSLVKNFRTSFNQEIEETSLNALIKRLANSNKTGDSDAVPAE